MRLYFVRYFYGDYHFIEEKINRMQEQDDEFMQRHMINLHAKCRV